MAVSSRFSPSDAFLNDARKRMVESQLRPSKVSDSRILEAMRNLPRERFLPSDLGALAYSDQNVALGKNRMLLQPVILARLEIQLALKREREETRRLAQDLEVRNRFIKATFGRYLSEEVVSAILDSPQGTSDFPGDFSPDGTVLALSRLTLAPRENWLEVPIRAGERLGVP